ncbi:hypothetical protein ADINL_1833 [Nitrincola lacisaponensis]|uniref:Uncharacterized protein n=2 Tax=Nitrincola lacisaponensis TaxID=267850 RepID=A0A063Y0D8_9GAMM|nr:hypothetical protein ADINL_1833 [Nitrincola lacisaponensis]
MAVLGIVVSVFALGLGVVNYRNNIDLTRRSVLLAEKKLLSEEFKEPLSRINNTVVQLLPVVGELRRELILTLTDLYRSVEQPSDECKYTYRPIPHHFSDLVLAIKDEIMSKFESEQFTSLAQGQIRILNIVPAIDIYPLLDRNQKTRYQSFKCLENKSVVRNYGALCEVDNSGFDRFFDLVATIQSSVNSLISSLDLSVMLEAMRGLQVANNTHIVKFNNDMEFAQNFNIVNNILTLLNDDYELDVSKRVAGRQCLVVGYAVLLACKLQLLLAATDTFLHKFEPS